MLFGTTFLVVADAIDDADVLPFLAVRFLIGGAVLAPIALRRPGTAHEVRDGVVAGSCLVVGFVLQTLGLRTTPPATSAFITYLLVVMVPLIAVVRTRRAPRPNVLVGVVLSVAGLACLTGGIASMGVGEVLTVGCAFAFALHIVVLGEVSGNHDPVRLTLWQVLTVGVVCLVPGAFTGGGYAFGPDVWAAAAFCGVGATAGAFWCMTYGQGVVPQTQAALILLLEPVSAGILGQLTGDPLGRVGVVGALLILAGVVVAELAGPRVPALGAELAVIPEDDAT